MRRLFPVLTIILFFSNCTTRSLSDIEKRYLINDKGNDKFYLIDFIKENQKSEKLGEIPMLMIDAELVTYHYKKDNKRIDISKAEIKRIEITEKEQSIPKYGSAGKYGVIQIYTD